MVAEGAYQPYRALCAGQPVKPGYAAVALNGLKLRNSLQNDAHGCLHSAEEIPLRGLHGDALKGRIEFAVSRKPERHCALSYSDRSGSARDMNRIGG